MPRRTLPALLLMAVALLVLTAAGCGGDGGGSAADTTTEAVAETDDSATDTESSADEADATETDETATSEDDMTASETDATETDAMDTDDETTVEDADTSTVDGSALATSEDCQELANLSTELSSAFGGTPDSDTEEYGEFLQAFADRAPEEVRDDFQVIADFYDEWLEVIRETDFESGETPTAEQIQKFTEIAQSIDQAKLTAASANISAWVTSNCVPGASGG